MFSFLKIFISFLCFSFIGLANASAACGKFVVVKGDVQIDVAKTKKSEKAKLNSEICSGDTVTAQKEARAKIVMVDGNELNISPDSKLTIEGYDYQPEKDKKKVLINVLFGKVRANVKQKYDDQSQDGASNSFQVKTKSAVAGVRGTDFLTSYNTSTGRSEVVTFSGKVDVGQSGPNGKIINPVSVVAGQKTFVAPNQAPTQPINVPAQELKQMNATTKSDSASNAPPTNANAGTQASKEPEKGDRDKKDAPATVGSASRTPASLSPNTSAPSSIGTAMLDANDLGGAAGSKVPDFSKSPLGEGPNLPINTPIVFQPPRCDVCNSAIQSGPSLVNIAITTHK